MLATLQHQWARRYLRLTHNSRTSDDDRARIREFFASGADALQFSWEVEALRVLIQSALFLFFAGLLVYLYNTHRTVFFTVLGWVAISSFRYVFITFMPILRLRNLLHSPRLMVIALFGSMEKLSQEVVQKWRMEIDHRILNRFFDSPPKGSELVQFQEIVHGLCRSSTVKDPESSVRRRLHESVKSLLERTGLSDSLSISEKIQHLVFCVKVADAARFSHVSWSTLKYIFPFGGSKALQTIELGQSLRRRSNSTHEYNGAEQENGLCAQTIIAGIISGVQAYDDHWVELAAAQLGKSKHVIQEYLEHSQESVLLANLTYITRQMLLTSLEDELSQYMAFASSSILPALSNFDVQHTLPQLQQEFRDLWIEIEQKAPDNEVLSGIRDQLLNIHLDLLHIADDISTPPRMSDSPLSFSHHASTSATPWPWQFPVHAVAAPTDDESSLDDSPV
jgi:Family of unknown function (DUF6535)